MSLNSFKIKNNIFSLTTIKENTPNWFHSNEVKLMVNDFVLLTHEEFYDNSFLEYVGLEMITNRHLSEDKLKSKMNSCHNAFFTMNKFYFKKSDKSKWYVLEDDDFKNFHDWLLAILNPDKYSNKLRKIKLKQIMK